MSGLVVRYIEECIVQKLKRHTSRYVRSAEAEHRTILEAALIRTRHRLLAAVLADMPDLGRDEDFERRQYAAGSVSDVFG